MQKVTRAALLCSAALLLSAAIAGATPIDFHITVNTSSLVGNSAAPFALDFQLNGGNNPTNPAFGDALVLVDISTPAAGVRTFSGTGTFSGVTVTAVAAPEPMSLLLVGAGLMSIGMRRWRRQSAGNSGKQPSNSRTG